MNKTYAMLASIIALTVTAPAFAADSSETTSVSGTDANGTTVKEKQSVKVKKHSNGNTDTTIKTEDSKDPKGLFNKSTGKSKETITTDENNNVIKDKKSVKGNETDETK